MSAHLLGFPICGQATQPLRFITAPIDPVRCHTQDPPTPDLLWGDQNGIGYGRPGLHARFNIPLCGAMAQ
jgi:hypothetical protein